MSSGAQLREAGGPDPYSFFSKGLRCPFSTENGKLPFGNEMVSIVVNTEINGC